MKEVITSRILRTILLLIAVCLVSIPAQAQYGGGSGTTASAETNTYVFLPGQSTVVQTGGIAGVHWTYSVEGLFQLTVDPDAGTASLAHVNANATDDSPLRRTLDPNEVFNMTSLLGAVLDDTMISFTGKAADGSDVLITVTIEDDLAYLVGQTIPPPNTADFFLFSLDAVAQRKYGGGTGEPNYPYLIYTAEQMNEIGLHEEDWDKHFKLMANIDLSSYTETDFNIIGIAWNNAFTGVFNGNGRTISNFSYILTDTDTNAVGLFRYVDGENALIKDLGLIDPNVDGTYTLSYIFQYIGSLVGNLNEGTITGCYVDGGSVSGNDFVGGLVGRNHYGTINNCTLSASVSGNDEVGGLVGGTFRGTITGCYVDGGSVSGNDLVGGLVGKNNSTISNCSSEGSVSGNDEVGGLVGRNYGTITGCYVDGGSVSGNEYVGGLVGSGGTITNCYSTTSVSGDRFVGGLVGDTRYSGTITCSYATSSVSGTGWYVGGLMGYNWGEVRDSFWDTQTSGQVTSGGGTGKTTAEMQTENTFTYAGWDFVAESTNGTEDIWWILEGRGYPRLWWELFAFSPDPRNGAFNVIQPLILSWVAGGSALQHDIYFGEDEEAVANATTENLGIYRGRQARVLTTYDPGNLELGKTYYWRIDEYNTDATISKGNVWSFTVAVFIVVDDFEDYNDLNPDDPKSNRIFKTWIDGFVTTTNGSTIGYMDAPFTEQSIVHGGKQSMPYFYDNSGPANYSEATANIANLVIGRDWTQNGVGVLSLWFYGDPANAPEPMYVAIANYNGPTAVVYHDNPDAALIDTWTEWKIDLTKFSDQGVDLTDVDTISIGFGDKNNPVPGGSGLVFFDDIRLYRPAPEPEPVQ
jgi:hypothetical protein